MIYLIDDKKKRQQIDFKWSDQKLARYSHTLIPIYDLETLEKESQKVFSQENVVIYHESFLNDTPLEGDASEKRRLLENFANKNPNFKLVIFSGSKDSRKLNGNLLHIPVGTLYTNLETFIKSDLNLNLLSYGENSEAEPFVYNQLEESINNFSGTANVSGNVLFVNSPKYSLYKPVLNAVEVNCFDRQTNSELDQLVRKWLSETVYNQIFIPMCFGNTLSDYNGLRLATHIRCTNTLNQFTPIHIYSPVDISMLLDNEYFNILKTKNVQLVDISKQGFEKPVNKSYTEFKQDELPKEISKLKLDPPLNYADSHSIANEWAIHQWTKTVGCDETDKLAKVFQNIEANLYFKYLKTINPISEPDKIPSDELKIDHSGNPKVLFVDDEIEKGWLDVFIHLFENINDIYLDYIGQEFKNQSQNEIIDKSIQKIKEDDIDVVILDFRLSPNDFSCSKIEDISSIHLLKKIKELNPGIQVIIFSATNKVWNLQALKDAGANGFVTKGSPENSSDSNYTEHSITDFVDLISGAFSRIFLKDFYKSLFQVKNNLDTCNYEDGTDFESFLKNLLFQLEIIDHAGKEVKSRKSISLDVVFLNCYNFLDLVKSQYITEKDYRFYIGIEETPLHRYDHDRGAFSDLGEFIKESHYDKPSWFQSMAGLLIDYFQVVTLNADSIQTLWQIKNWRNKYIHEGKSHFSQSELLSIVHLMVKLTSSMKE